MSLLQHANRSAQPASCSQPTFNDADQHSHQLEVVAIIIAVNLSLRVWLGSSRSYWKDVSAVALAMLWKNRNILHPLAQYTSQSYSYLTALFVLLAIIIPRLFTARVKDISEPQPPAEATHGFLRPMVFPCRTTHTRLFPTKHSFGYSYLFVGIPVGWAGSPSRLLSTDTWRGRPSWFSVDNIDYLARGVHPDGLQGKLKEYLASQGIDAGQYENAYLVTAPRFLGFSFNPVSFWYLYDKWQTLSAMILEVNNTFDERRMYFMQNKTDTNSPNKTFSNEWAKDFHVSPFNDREGSYSLTAKHLHSPHGSITLDNNIVLRSNNGKAKIVARVFSTENGLDPTSMSRFESWWFLAKWCWVGFLTNPRILREARRLWVKKLQVYYRPEVLISSIGRNETAEEATLEIYFYEYLKSLVKDSSQHLTILYTPAAGTHSGRSVHIGSEQSVMSANKIEIRVLTPAFYAEMIRDQVIIETFRKYCFEPGSGEAMATVSDHAALEALIASYTPRLSRNKASHIILRPYILLRRNNISKIWRLLTSSQEFTSVADSEYDLFIESLSQNVTGHYANIVTRLLLADRLAFGFMPLFSVLVGSLWLLNLYASTSIVESLANFGWSYARGMVVVVSLLSLHGWRRLG